MAKNFRLVCLFLVFMGALNASAEIAVIMNGGSNVSALTEEQLSRLFLGKTNSFPSGAQAVPINQEEGSAIREKFNEIICKKSAAQYKAYWSQLVFTGKGAPPKEAANDAAVKSLVQSNPNMIGYIDSKAVDASVKVVYKF